MMAPPRPIVMVIVGGGNEWLGGVTYGIITAGDTPPDPVAATVIVLPVVGRVEMVAVNVPSGFTVMLLPGTVVTLLSGAGVMTVIIGVVPDGRVPPTVMDVPVGGAVTETSRSALAGLETP